jgi:hypothetical protein
MDINLLNNKTILRFILYFRRMLGIGPEIRRGSSSRYLKIYDTYTNKNQQRTLSETLCPSPGGCCRSVSSLAAQLHDSAC